MKKAENQNRLKTLIENKKVRKILLAVICVIAVLLAFRLFLLVFSVGEFEIEGDTKYSINEIVNAAGIRKGDRLYAIDEDEAEERLMQKCPYIESVSIEQKFPDTVCFVIKERGSGWYLQIGEDFYALDYDLKVLMETTDESIMTKRGLTKLVLPELQSAVRDELPEFGKGDERLISETLRVIDAIRKHDLKERITYINLENRFEIRMFVDETYEVYFGDMSDAKAKFDMIDKVIEDSKNKGYIGGRITFNGPTDPAFKGYFPEDSEQGEEENGIG
jgi:cell division septal protein FtsQ